MSEGGRTLGEYQQDLDLKPSDFKGTTLNFGAGTSNLKLDLERAGVKDPQIIDLDLVFDPSDQSLYNPLSPFINWLFDRKINRERPLERRAQLLSQKRRLLGTQDRDMVNADGRHLPLADKSVDLVIALQSTYQIPEEGQDLVFSELLRVAKKEVRVFPIWGQEFEILRQQAKKQGFKIMACKPISPMPFSKIDLTKNPQIIIPKRHRSPAWAIGKTLMSASTRGGHSIRLVRGNYKV